MKKKLTEDLTFFYNGLYPYRSKLVSQKTNLVTLGIGGNIGNVIKTFKQLFRIFLTDSRFDIIQTSPILKNPPFGFLEQDYFYNAIIVLKTNLYPFELLRQMQKYEKRFKRKRSFKDAPRTLDIDIIFFNKIQLNRKNLIIPHKDYKNRQSVMLPLKTL